MTDDSLPTQVLVITAHTDDVDFGAAGTVAYWTERGVKVSYCVTTDGAAGALDPTADPTTLAAVRQEEQRAAAAEVGVDDVHFLGYPDSQLEPGFPLRRDLCRVIRGVRPDRILTQSPERNWRSVHASHPDHLITGEAVLRAVYPDARNPFHHPELLAEGLEPHVVEEVWLMASPRADHVVDITEYVDRKIAALRCHKSQVGDGEHLEDRIKGWMGHIATEHGLPEGRYAEVFQVIETR